MITKRGRTPKYGIPRNVCISLRFTSEEMDLLQDCADRLDISRTDAIAKGLELLKKELEKNEQI